MKLHMLVCIQTLVAAKKYDLHFAIFLTKVAVEAFYLDPCYFIFTEMSVMFSCDHRVALVVSIIRPWVKIEKLNRSIMGEVLIVTC